MRAAFVVLCLAACSGRGVEIEVFTEDGSKIDRVELYLAYEQCNDCPRGVGWPGARSRPEGNIYFFKDEQRVAADVQPDGSFALHLTADTGYTDPPWVAVVGFAGDKATSIKILRDVHIPRTHVERWQVYLHPALLASEDVSTPGPMSPTYRALEWRRAPTTELSDPAGCVAYQKFDQGQWMTEYFVPKSDPDCDGLEPECSPYWYAFNKDRLPATCATASGDTTLPGVCRAGTTLCADGQTSSSACMPGVVCMPSEICSSCSSDVPVDSCITQTLTATDSTAPYASCPFTPDAATTDKFPCTNSTNVATLDVPAMGSLCTAVAFRAMDDPLGNPSGELKLGDQLGTVFQVHLGTGRDPCQILITWQEGSATPFASGAKALLDITYANTKHVLYPVNLTAAMPITCTGATTITTTCTNEMRASTQDSMWRCVAP